ncbi:hypothetical protein APHNP_0602 [Anaplasma phagocytophilum str. ApNP]|uniref:Uncharacterized protein n=2 Tax=Anaplasma phagocytophilum TaxID=948 RepID=A0A0F3NFY2_ANAPH|nr:hypothetical protein APHMUC_0805 [Anaplasma phagocytophilum str. ApMUC09]KJV66993.1 hypothetical protein APHNP_0606 [Anaplasma phagocytophilum str. ApNP]KJV67507.1 hypothetical protein APHNP_0602 [Anaplasma phagocytophilum str. ApNP]
MFRFWGLFSQVHLRARLVPHVRAKVGFERIILGISTC